MRQCAILERHYTCIDGGKFLYRPRKSKPKSIGLQDRCPLCDKKSTHSHTKKLRRRGRINSITFYVHVLPKFRFSSKPHILNDKWLEQIEGMLKV